MTRKQALVAAGLVVLAAWTAAAGVPALWALKGGEEGGAADALTFVQRSVADRIALEPMVVLDSAGFAYVNTLTTVGPQWTLAPEVWRSADQGQTWTDVTPRDLGLLPRRAITGDPYLYLDPRTDRLFSVDFEGGFVPKFSELGQRYCNFISWSDDRGASWAISELCPGNDHQTLFAGPPVPGVEPQGYPSLLYLCDNQRAPGSGPQGSCTTSRDGGATWGPRVRVFPECDKDRQFGHGHASDADGTMYLPKGACRSYGPPSWRAQGEGEAWVAISRDGGTTFQTVVVDNTVGFIDIAVEAHEARVDTDAAGNVYYLFLDRDSVPRLSVSTDQGRTWSAPRAVGQAGLTAYMLSDIVAGDDGRVAWTYVASDHPGGWNELYKVDGPAEATWHAYVGMTLDALDPQGEVLSGRVTPADDPLHRGPCPVRCLSGWPPPIGGYATGNPSGIGMYDFISMDIDPTTGFVWVAMMDMCYGACAQEGGTEQWPNDPLGAVGIQTGGPRLIT